MSGSQFRLIYTPDQSASIWKLIASNPGQFYYNVVNPQLTSSTLTINVPYPFVTQGAVPIHIFGGVTPATGNGITCFEPSLTEVANSSTQVALSCYGANPTFASMCPVTVSPPASLLGGVAYINMHLDYGLEGTTNLTKGGSGNDAVDATTPSIVIVPDKQSYMFSDSTPGGDTVQNENVFKRDPGIGGLVRLSATNDPVPNVTVQIYDSSNRLLVTTSTDQDGWYMWQYKYTGRATTFTVNLPAYNQAQTATLKSNGFAVVSFTLP